MHMLLSKTHQQDNMGVGLVHALLKRFLLF